MQSLGLVLYPPVSPFGGCVCDILLIVMFCMFFYYRFRRTKQFCFSSNHFRGKYSIYLIFLGKILSAYSQETFEWLRVFQCLLFCFSFLATCKYAFRCVRIWHHVSKDPVKGPLSTVIRCMDGYKGCSSSFLK